MKRFVIAVFFLLAYASFANQTFLQTDAQQISDWENPRVFGINKELPHATLTPFPSQRAARAADTAASPYVQSLNGQWKFN